MMGDTRVLALPRRVRSMLPLVLMINAKCSYQGSIAKEKNKKMTDNVILDLKKWMMS